VSTRIIPPSGFFKDVTFRERVFACPSFTSFISRRHRLLDLDADWYHIALIKILTRMKHRYPKSVYHECQGNFAGAASFARRSSNSSSSPSPIDFASAHPDTQTKIRPRPTSTSTPTPTRKNPPLTECLDETQTRVCVGGCTSEGEGWGCV